MNNSEDYNDQLDRYFRDEMEAEERQKFLSEVESNPSLQKQFEQHKELLKAIELSSLADLKEQLKEREAQHAKSPSAKSFMFLKIAAAVSLIMVFSWLIISNSGDPISTEQLYASNYEPYPNVVSPIDRSSQFDSKNPYALYEMEEYVKALDILKTIEGNDTASFYEGQVHLALQQPDEAIENFKHIPSGSDFKAPANWYLALAYLGKNDMDKAKETLSSIVEGKGDYSQRAQALLDNL